MPSQLLTDVGVRNLPAPPAGRVEHHDTRCRGLTLRITSAGERTWSFRYRNASGRTMRATLGRYPGISLAAARELADKLRFAVAQGGDPADAKKTARVEAEERSFGHLAERFMREHSRRFKRSASDDERMLAKHVLPKWRHRPFAEIKRREVIALLESIVAAGTPVSASRVHALIRKMFNFAISRGLLENNPATVIGKIVEERSRDRILSDDEARLFWIATAGDGPFTPTVGLALRLALLTGCRAGEIAGLRRDEVLDLDDTTKARLNLPPERTKPNRRHVLPLSPMACEVVRRALATSTAESFVFSTRAPTEDAPISSPALTLAMRRLAVVVKDEGKARHQLADLPGSATWRSHPPGVHDLRRTVASRLIEAGVAVDTVRKVLNHSASSGDVLSRHYDRSAAEPPMRLALGRWADELARIVGEAPADEVVIPLRARVPA
ncbi:MAG: site-specific integrase [Phreatobacter sp.]|nr:site-specific integrase [Phreatobacter sp.]